MTETLFAVDVFVADIYTASKGQKTVDYYDFAVVAVVKKIVKQGIDGIEN
jgi:hypothetical protein